MRFLDHADLKGDEIDHDVLGSHRENAKIDNNKTRYMYSTSM